MPNVFLSNVTNHPNPPLLKGGEGGILPPFKSFVGGILTLIAVLLAALPSSTIIAQSPSGSIGHQGVGVIIHTAKPYKKIIDAIEGLGGTEGIVSTLYARVGSETRGRRVWKRFSFTIDPGVRHQPRTRVLGLTAPYRFTWSM